MQFHTVSFDAAVGRYPTWMSGATHGDAGRGIPPAPGAELARLIEEEGLTVLNLPTTYWHQWVDESSRLRMSRPPPLRLVIVGGDQALGNGRRMVRPDTRAGRGALNTTGPRRRRSVSTLDNPERRRTPAACLGWRSVGPWKHPGVRASGRSARAPVIRSAWRGSCTSAGGA